jgi:hypothetical protein
MHVAGEAVQEGGLGGRCQQALRLPLSVMFDETRAELGERRCSGELAPDARCRSPVSGDRSREDHLTVFRPLPGVVGGVEPRLYPGGARIVADERGRASLAEREQESHGHHRLAGARLPGQHVQARRELELEVGDDPEAADVELAQHAGDASAGR